MKAREVKRKVKRNRKFLKHLTFPACALAVLSLAAAVLWRVPFTRAAVNSVHVGTWDEFRLAVLDATVDEIVLLNDVARAGALPGDRLAAITRDLTIKSGPGNRFTLAFGADANAAAGIVLVNAALPATLRLENINVLKTAGNNVITGAGTAADWGTNWKIELENVTTPTANQRGLVDAARARVEVFGTESDLCLEANGYHHFNVTDFTVAAGAEMRMGTRITTGGASDAVLSAGGAVTLRDGAKLLIVNKGTSTGGGAAGSHGMYGGTGLTLEPGASLAVRAERANGIHNMGGPVTLGRDAALAVAAGSIGIQGAMPALTLGEKAAADITVTGSAADDYGISGSIGAVTLEPASALMITAAAKNAQGDITAGCHGMVGDITGLTMKANSVLTIEAGRKGYETTVDTYLTMTDGAVFHAATGGGSAACALRLANDGNNADSAHISLSGDGTALHAIRKDNGSGTDEASAAIAALGNEISIHVADNAKIECFNEKNTAMYLGGSGARAAASEFNITSGGSLDLAAGGSGGNLYAALRFAFTGGYTFHIDGGKLSVERRYESGSNAPAIRMYGGKNRIEVINGGEFRVRHFGNGTPTNGTAVGSNNVGILYSGASASTGGDSFFASGKGSVIEILSDYGTAILASDTNHSSIDVEAREGAVFLVHGNTASAASAAIYAAANDCPLGFTLDCPLYFDIRNNCAAGAPAVYNETNNANAAQNFTRVKDSDFSIWQSKSGATPAYFESPPTMAWTLLDFKVSGRWMHWVETADPPGFPAPPNNPYFTGTSGTATGAPNIGMQNYSRINANNAKPVIDNLRVPADADKYLHGHASVPEGLAGLRGAWENEVYVTVEVRDAGGNPVPIRDMHGNYADTAEWNTLPGGLDVYGEACDGIFRAPYIPQDPAAHAYVPYDWLPAPAQGEPCFLPAGYTFTVLSAYRSSTGSVTERLAAGETAPRVHASDYAPDIAFPLLEAQGGVFAACVDKTPPQPAGIDGETDNLGQLAVAAGSQAIRGVSPEKTGVTVQFAVKKQGGTQFSIVTTDGTPFDSGGIPVTVASAAGVWELAVPGHLALEPGDAIQVFLLDSQGNKNPAEDTEFHDARFVTDDYFPAGAVAHVVESAFKLHIRQLVHNPGGIPVRAWPCEGYSTIADRKMSPAAPAKHYNAVTRAGFSNEAQYTTVALKGVFRYDTVTIQNVVPQYFVPAGYALLAGDTAPASLAAPTPGEIQISVDTEREYWVTVFIRPVSRGTPRYAVGILDQPFGPVTG